MQTANSNRSLLKASLFLLFFLPIIIPQAPLPLIVFILLQLPTMDPIWSEFLAIDLDEWQPPLENPLLEPQEEQQARITGFNPLCASHAADRATCCWRCASVNPFMGCPGCMMVEQWWTDTHTVPGWVVGTTLEFGKPREPGVLDDGILERDLEEDDSEGGSQDGAICVQDEVVVGTGFDEGIDVGDEVGDTAEDLEETFMSIDPGSLSPSQGSQLSVTTGDEANPEEEEEDDDDNRDSLEPSQHNVRGDKDNVSYTTPVEAPKVSAAPAGVTQYKGPDLAPVDEPQDSIQEAFKRTARKRPYHKRSSYSYSPPAEDSDSDYSPDKRKPKHPKAMTTTAKIGPRRVTKNPNTKLTKSSKSSKPAQLSKSANTAPDVKNTDASSNQSLHGPESDAIPFIDCEKAAAYVPTADRAMFANRARSAKYAIKADKVLPRPGLAYEAPEVIKKDIFNLGQDFNERKRKFTGSPSRHAKEAVFADRAFAAVYAGQATTAEVVTKPQ